MGALARDQLGRGGDQVHVLSRNIVGEIGHALRKRQSRHERQAPRVGVGLRKVGQLDTWRQQQHLDQR